MARADMADGSPSRRSIICVHQDHLVPPVSIDFLELWNGASETISRQGNNAWGGSYRGRPELAESLWPILQAVTAGMRPDAIRGRLSQMRALFRFLDGYERRFGNAINSLSDIQDAHGILWTKPPNDGTWDPPGAPLFSEVKRVIGMAKADANQPFWWPPMTRTTPRADSPDEKHARALLHALKRSAHDILRRWQKADELAAAGRNLIEAGKGCRPVEQVTDADCHTTFRALISRTGNPIPSKEDLASALGFRNVPKWWPVQYSDLLAGSYPTSSDLCTFASLFMARSGWNPSTTLDLDISSDDWAIKHGSGRNVMWWIQSYKHRSRTWQDTLSPERLTTGCYNLAKVLALRTAPLRKLAVEEPSRCMWPAIGQRSPWLGVTTGNGGGRVFVLTRPATINTALRKIIKESNTRLDVVERHTSPAPTEGAVDVGNSSRIPLDFSCTDFRDAFASFTFQDSRYAWAMAQWALGQKHLSSTRHYLRSRAWQRHTREAIRRFGTILFDEIEVHRRVDPTILRALAAGHSIDEERLRRLQDWRSRTYVGMGCNDPTQPDEHIDPGHPRDGTTLCMNGYRCASCSQGVVLDDSVPHLAKRAAELEWLQRHASLTEWSESTHAADQAVLRATLSQWPEDLVRHHLDEWTARIESGSHRVLRFSGER